MGCQDVVLSPFQASFFTACLNNCGRGDKNLGTTTCHKVVVGGKQASKVSSLYNTFAPTKPLFVCVGRTSSRSYS